METRTVIRTRGNPHGHLILRGGRQPNHDPDSVMRSSLALVNRELCAALTNDARFRLNLVATEPRSEPRSEAMARPLGGGRSGPAVFYVYGAADGQFKSAAALRGEFAPLLAGRAPDEVVPSVTVQSTVRLASTPPLLGSVAVEL